MNDGDVVELCTFYSLTGSSSIALSRAELSCIVAIK